MNNRSSSSTSNNNNSNTASVWRPAILSPTGDFEEPPGSVDGQTKDSKNEDQHMSSGWEQPSRLEGPATRTSISGEAGGATESTEKRGEEGFQAQHLPTRGEAAASGRVSRDLEEGNETVPGPPSSGPSRPLEGEVDAAGQAYPLE
eukprot:CAMPEP_0206589678 /NCGR_PEP_ID=MMETSP0325_2-20121206/39081_1 /ASSEMBLY_ACC=CAM_ASM_000347 /TAXON_ID=2866 /ORGANISM="Crypthecodinium cohnii, Strain Seligo" /LENGTH=145 /DNA_ID=CAMNT_0054098313 /DNA_START=15 /DNA_END=449 /DNA_ORIENTATION=-